MPEKLGPRPRPTNRRRLRPPKAIIRRAYSKARNRNQPCRILSRSASEPILYALQFDVISRNQDQDGGAEINKKHHNLFFPRLNSFTDGGFFSSSPSLLPQSLSSPRPNFMEEAKVVVSVTVEGSPGPVRAMVKLGATVDDAIGVVVDRYKREGRSPRLDWERPDSSFELHHSHFSLQSLNKSAKIGEVGSRSFYLRQSCSSHCSFNSASEGREATGGGEAELLDGRLQTVPPPAHLFLSFVATSFSKIKRRTKKLWRVVTCITCV